MTYSQLAQPQSPYRALRQGARPAPAPAASASASTSASVPIFGSAAPAIAQRQPSPPTTPVPVPPGLDSWRDLISFRPSQEIQRSLIDDHVPDWSVHRIEDAWGAINLDYYPVEVTNLPTFNGHQLSPAELLTHMRLCLNDLVGTTNASFAAYDNANAKKWLSDDPTGAVVHIDMLSGSQYANFDDGSVVVSDGQPSSWIFSPIWTLGDFDHPVAGNRRFGYTQSGGTCTFYTRGADRPKGAIDALLASIIFSSAHALWLNLQQGLARFVNDNGGAATIGTAVSHRYDWDEVKRLYYAPTVDWLDTDPPGVEFGGGDFGGAGGGGGW
ncbi:MAG: hypothetical protein QOG44_1664 [Acidimicrobiaceae bacterium]|jgi:hypothetical protein|nr:hypothetical protein [Acidimicrobiaceae bacterium]MDQ1391519.1 hypothetical protein [Acidimicrobiaceae bacterium]